MYFLLNIFIWIRKNLIRIIFNEYPNIFLEIKKSDFKSDKKINLISSTNNFWVSKEMSKKWNSFSKIKNINTEIFSNSDVNNFMFDNFKNDLIYEIYKKSQIPVQKIDIFRICFIYRNGGIWLDLKSEVSIKTALDIYSKAKKNNGLLMFEPRKIDVIKNKNNRICKTREYVIHNGFFFLPKNSFFLKQLIKNVEKDYLYFEDIILLKPKQGIMNLTGPNQFTRTYHLLSSKDKPLLVSQKEINWQYISKYGEFISPIKFPKHYSSSTNKEIINSNSLIELDN